MNWLKKLFCWNAGGQFEYLPPPFKPYYGVYSEPKLSGGKVLFPIFFCRRPPIAIGPVYDSGRIIVDYIEGIQKAEDRADELNSLNNLGDYA